MDGINLEIDDITKDVSLLMQKVADELSRYRLSTSEYEKGSIYIAFFLGREYFLTTKDALSHGHVVGGGCTLRTCMENLADLMYIFHKPSKTEEYAKAYILSMEVYRSKMVNMCSIKSDEIHKKRMAKQINSWTGATIEERLKTIGDSLILVYDMFSYFSHPNPASLTYMNIEGLNKGQINLAKQGNCTVAIFLMAFGANHNIFQSINIEELDVIANKLGINLHS